MADLSRLTQWIESFVDSSSSPSHQSESLEAVASLVKNDLLTLETLVREMDMYLTTTDNIIRSRGMLLLGEVLTHLSSKPLDVATVHTLIGFFSDRLADWKALRGALVGCLALMRRKGNASTVSWSDAKAVAYSHIQNIQVQSLGQHDRMLCFQLLVCLLESYPDAVASLGDDLVYGICEAIDGEKDPHCLMLTFHIVEVIAKLFPDPSGTLANFAGDLFELLSCYFPIHFTHVKEEDGNIKRDDLAEALMIFFFVQLAFSASPLFEPFSVPLLVEKLSSTLPMAKVDSLKYLNDCTTKYGAERMAKHFGAIWASLKDAIYTSVSESASSFTSESIDGFSFSENEITKEALKVLQNLVMQNDSSLLSSIFSDENINEIFNTMDSYMYCNEVPSENKLKLYVVGRILYISAKASSTSCSKIFQRLFPILLDTLGVLTRDSSVNRLPDNKFFPPRRLNFGALYLCVELLSASRDLVAGSEEDTRCRSVDDTYYSMLQTYSSSLTQVFCSIFQMNTTKDAHGPEIYVAVKGLQILATFPGEFSPISKSIFEKVLLAFMSIITVDFNETLLWKMALKALVHIGSFVDRYDGSEAALSYEDVVIEKIVSLMSLNDSTMPLILILEVVSDIGTSRLRYLLKTFQGMEGAIFSNITMIEGSSNAAEIVIKLLECYTMKVLPRIQENGGLQEVLLKFTIKILNQFENPAFCSSLVHEKMLLDAITSAIKLSAQSCSEERQTIIVEKAYSILTTRKIFLLETSLSVSAPFHLEGLHLALQKDNFSCIDEWILALFASIIIAIRPQTRIPNVRAILHLLTVTVLEGSVHSAQALASMINKLGVKSEEIGLDSELSVDEAIDIIFRTKYQQPNDNGTSSGHDMGLVDFCSSEVRNSSLRVNAIVGLAWIGKGLLLRGHEKVKDVAMVCLECLLSKNDTYSPSKQGLSERLPEDFQLLIMKTAADAFHILMSDSDVCLNRKFHAIVRPLYKQRFFSIIIPILQSLVRKSCSSVSRCMLYRAFAHVVTAIPISVIINDAKKLVPMLLEALLTVSGDIQHKDIVYGLLLVLSGILTDKNGQEAIAENAHIVINCLTGLIPYPHMMLVRETGIQCLVAVSELPHARIYPMRRQVLDAVSKALDDPRRAVRQEAVRCRQAWASIASRSLRF